jgi:hypothetical protein
MFLVLAMSFSKGLVWVEYQASKEFISRNLCINKFKPRLNCQGKCQMVKQIAETEKEGTSAPFQKIKLLPDETALVCSSDIIPVFADKTGKDKNVFLNQAAYNSPVFPIFHPPA